MKKYRRYMNGVKAPGTLHQRLRELKAPEKKPVPWARYGSMAAALALALGLGGYGVHYYNTAVNPRGEAFLERTQAFDPVADPDIALEDPGDVTEAGEKTLGGYDVREERGGVAVVCHYILPYIEYGEAEGSVDLDWDIPEGAARRDLTLDEIVALMGGEDALSTHLDWGEEYVLTGWAAWYEDGSFWGAYINGVWPNYGGPANQFEFAVTAGQLPPTCFGYPDSVTQEIRGLTVTADKADWTTELGGRTIYHSERRVSFMKDDYGYRFEMSSGDPDMAEEMVSRLVCRVADEGLALAVLDPAAPVKTYTCAVCGNTFPVGAEHNDPVVTATGDGEGAIPGFVPDYDPAYENGVPDQDGSPRDRGENWCGTQGADTETCPDCGAAYPVGSEHDCAMCDGYPLPHTSEICGYPLAPGGDNAPAISAEICGLPLNPGGDVATETIYD